MVDSNAKNPNNVTFMSSTRTIHSDEGVQAFTLMYSHSIMLYPGIPRTLFFESSNKTDFLD